jgi:NhaP-type Na+/H+ or K+/H+ antiporter
MGAIGWYVLVGSVLFSMGLFAARLGGMPITSAILYLVVGVLVGPTVFNLFHFNPLKSAAWLEVITEIAVLISLYTCGLKLKVPLRSRLWRIPLRLATISMVVGIALVSAFAHWVLAMPWGAAILIGALLAPTDPVLATDVQVRRPGDNDRLRFGLTAEAGLNDGTAFPFVMLGLGLLGLHDIGDGGRWLLVDVLWASVAGIGLGALLGAGVARLVFTLRVHRRETRFMDDFLGLGLIALTNGLALAISAYAFLAVFAAAVALRQTEQHLMARHRHRLDPADRRAISLADSSMHFNEQLERIGEVLLILLLRQFVALGCGPGGGVRVRGGAAAGGLSGPDRQRRGPSDPALHGLVRRARDRLAVLPDVRHQPRPRSGARASDPVDHADRRDAVDHRARHECQALDAALRAGGLKGRSGRPATQAVRNRIEKVSARMRTSALVERSSSLSPAMPSTSIATTAWAMKTGSAARPSTCSGDHSQAALPRGPKRISTTASAAALSTRSAPKCHLSNSVAHTG